jgi:hypothetical protein
MPTVDLDHLDGRLGRQVGDEGSESVVAHAPVIEVRDHLPEA